MATASDTVSHDESGILAKKPKLDGKPNTEQNQLNIKIISVA